MLPPVMAALDSDGRLVLPPGGVLCCPLVAALDGGGCLARLAGRRVEPFAPTQHELEDEVAGHRYEEDEEEEEDLEGRRDVRGDEVEDHRGRRLTHLEAGEGRLTVLREEEAEETWTRGRRGVTTMTRG